MEIETKPIESFDKEIRQIIPSDYKIKDEKLNLIEYNESQKDTSISALVTQIPLIDEDFKSNEKDFPKDKFDVNNQQLDLRENNSWSFQLCDVSLVEFMEGIYK
jgi:hypothetical protein